MKRVTKVGAATATAVVCAGGVSSSVLGFGDPGSEQRDVSGYQDYVTGHYDRVIMLDGNGQQIRDPREKDFRWAATHPDLMLTEGERACGWLAGEPDPPRFGADESRYGRHVMTTRYLKTAAMEERIRHTELGQTYVVAGAWSYLCPALADEKTTRPPEGD